MGEFFAESANNGSASRLLPDAPVHPRKLFPALCDMVGQFHRPHDGLDVFGCDLFSIGAQANRSLILALGDGDGHGRALWGWGIGAPLPQTDTSGS